MAYLRANQGADLFPDLENKEKILIPRVFLALSHMYSLNKERIQRRLVHGKDVHVRCQVNVYHGINLQTWQETLSIHEMIIIFPIQQRDCLGINCNHVFLFQSIYRSTVKLTSSASLLSHFSWLNCTKVPQSITALYLYTLQFFPAFKYPVVFQT